MKKLVLIICHLLFWIFTTLSVPYLFTIIWAVFAVRMRPKTGEKFEIDTDDPATYILTGIGVLIFYASYFSLNFFVKRPIRFIWILGFYSVCTLVISLPADIMSEQSARMLGPVLYFNLSGFLFKACVEWFKDRKTKAELEKDSLASQLELLKSKLNPHFLFNTLTTLMSLYKMTR